MTGNHRGEGPGPWATYLAILGGSVLLVVLCGVLALLVL